MPGATSSAWTKLSLLRLFRRGTITGSTRDLSSLRVRDVMDTRKVWVETADGLDAIVNQMARYHVRSVPVVTRAGSARRLVGIVSYRDLGRLITRLPASVRDPEWHRS
jgi:CBS domain-containing protein